MKTREERLKWIVKFAQLDLAQLSEGDRLNLRDDFLVFFCKKAPGWYPMSLTGGFYLNPFKPKPNELTHKDQTELQERCLEILRSLLDHTPLALGQELKIRWGIILNKRTLTQISGPTPELFLWMLFFLLSGEGGMRIQRCAECSRIFYREHGAQKHCSRRCATRVYMRRYRASKGKDRESEANHEQYVKRRKGETNAKLKITKRPKSTRT